MKLSSIDLSTSPKHVIIFGPSGSGKTKLALALAEHYNIHLLSLENGHSVGKQLPTAWQDRINVIRIPDTKAAPVGMAAILRLVKMGRINLCEVHGMDNCATCMKIEGAGWNALDLSTLGPQDILVLDTTTQLTFSTMSHIGKGAGDEWKPEFEDWRKLKNFMEMVFSFFQVAPFNIITISHEELVQTEGEANKDFEKSSSFKLVPSAGSANFARSFARYFDTVVYTEVKNGKHIFNSKTTYSNSVLTKDRFNIDVNANPEKGLLPLFQGQAGNLAIKK